MGSVDKGHLRRCVKFDKKRQTGNISWTQEVPLSGGKFKERGKRRNAARGGLDRHRNNAPLEEGKKQKGGEEKSTIRVQLLRKGGKEKKERTYICSIRTASTGL